MIRLLCYALFRLLLLNLGVFYHTLLLVSTPIFISDVIFPFLSVFTLLSLFHSSENNGSFLEELHNDSDRF